MRFQLLIISLYACSCLIAQETATDRLKDFNVKNQVAIHGYDPTCYFKLNKPKEGNPAITSTYKGITYQFVSKENKMDFDKNPGRYEPQYGGWCAFAMGDYGKKVDVNPQTYKIINDKLYLFYNSYLNNTLKSWEKDENNLLKSADKNWLTLINK